MDSTHSSVVLADSVLPSEDSSAAEVDTPGSEADIADNTAGSVAGNFPSAVGQQEDGQGHSFFSSKRWLLQLQALRPVSEESI